MIPNEVARMYWRELIKQDMTQRQLTKNVFLDRRLWRTRIIVECWLGN